MAKSNALPPTSKQVHERKYGKGAIAREFVAAMDETIDIFGERMPHTTIRHPGHDLRRKRRKNEDNQSDEPDEFSVAPHSESGSSDEDEEIQRLKDLTDKGLIREPVYIPGSDY